MVQESPEHMIDRLFAAPDLTLDVSEYTIFNEDAATVVMAGRTELGGIVVWNFEPGQENDYHLHTASEHLLLVVERECDFTLGDRPPVDVGPGQLVVIPANVPHGIRNRTDRRASYVAVTSLGPRDKVLVPRPEAAGSGRAQTVRPIGPHGGA